jgi:hypothetical protein
MVMITLRIQSLIITLHFVASREDDDVGVSSEMTHASSDDYHRDSSLSPLLTLGLGSIYERTSGYQSYRFRTALTSILPKTAF